MFGFEAKLSIEVYLVSRAGSTDTRNQNLRSISDLFRRHESNENFRIAKRATIEKLIF